MSEEESRKDELILALVTELKRHWTHESNPCLCSKCQFFSKYKKLIAKVERDEMARIRNILTTR